MAMPMADDDADGDADGDVEQEADDDAMPTALSAALPHNCRHLSFVPSVCMPMPKSFKTASLTATQATLPQAVLHMYSIRTP